MTRIAPVLVALVLFAMVAWGLHGAFLRAPTEQQMGDVQRIFYFHAPAGIVSFLAFIVCGIASALFLWTRRMVYDTWALASAEIGLVLCTIVLVTGPLWAKPVWGTWWTWEARLTMTLVLWLIFVAYMLVRRYAENRDQQARFAAVIGIIGALDIPVVYLSVRIWRGLHPVVVRESGGGGLAPEMRSVFLFCILMYLVVYACLLAVRVPLGRAEDELESLREQLLNRRGA